VRIDGSYLKTPLTKLKLSASARISYKGRHYYLLIKELPENIPLFYQGEKVGRLMSQGKQVIGSGSAHPTGITYKFIERGETFLKFEDEQQLANYLYGYGIVLKK
ncbi:10043_t:CDS:2, partial [Ambispora leptoticha]